MTTPAAIHGRTWTRALLALLSGVVLQLFIHRLSQQLGGWLSPVFWSLLSLVLLRGLAPGPARMEALRCLGLLVVVILNLRMLSWLLGSAWSQAMDGRVPEVDITVPYLFLLGPLQCFGAGFLIGRRLRVLPRWISVPVPLVLVWVGALVSSLRV